MRGPNMVLYNGSALSLPTFFFLATPLWILCNIMHNCVNKKNNNNKNVICQSTNNNMNNIHRNHKYLRE